MNKQSRLVTASKELLRGNFGNAFKSLATTNINPAAYRTGDFWFFGSGGTDHYFSFADLNSCLQAYTDCPPVAAIINRQAQAFVNGKTYVLNTQGKEAITPEAKKLRKLLVTSPNPLQNGKQFDAQGYIYRRLFGFNVVLVNKPVGFGSIDADSLWNIPPYMLEIKERKNAFYNAKNIKDCIESIHINYKGYRTPLDLDSLYIIKDFTVSMNSMVFPESTIRALRMPINNIMGAYESRNVLINKRGPMSIISSEKSDESGNVALSSGEKEQIQKDFQSKYGLRKNQIQHIITSANIKVQQVGFSTRDLMLMEEVEESSVAVCNGLNFPPFLLGLRDATFNNQNAAEKALYQNGIMPDAESIMEQWSQFFEVDKLNLKLEKDYAHITVLQEDKKLEAEARKTRNEALEKEFRYNMITLNRWLELNGEDTMPDANIYFSDLVRLYGDPMKALQNSNNPNPNNQNTHEQQQAAG